jgi:[ribosomal protein S5]-alanine N-acetyltransferase
MAVYADPAVSRWLPSAATTGSTAGVEALLASWAEADGSGSECLGHWAVRPQSGAGVVGDVVGGVSLQPAPHASESVAIGWALSSTVWGHGYAAEASDALTRWAMHEGGVLEVFAFVQPRNRRAVATAERIGMEWVVDLEQSSGGPYRVYRLRHGDLDWHD